MKISSSHRNLLSIFALCVLAFWGFGSIFSDLNLSISAEVSTAAFGALFIILTTKFLMEQENEAKRKEFIFQQNVVQYMKYAELQLKSLEDGKLTQQEIDEIKLRHAQLLITGSDGAINYSKDFLAKAIEAFEESKGQNIKEDTRNELAKYTADFLLAARSGLYLPNDNINKEEQKQFFLNSEKKARKATSIEENKDYISRGEEGRKIIEELIQKIREWGYFTKTTANQLTVYPNDEYKQGTAVCFIKSTKSEFKVQSFVTEQLEALSKVSENYADLNAQVAISKKSNPNKREIRLSFDNNVFNSNERAERFHQILNDLRDFRESNK